MQTSIYSLLTSITNEFQHQTNQTFYMDRFDIKSPMGVDMPFDKQN